MKFKTQIEYTVVNDSEFSIDCLKFSFIFHSYNKKKKKKMNRFILFFLGTMLSYCFARNENFDCGEFLDEIILKYQEKIFFFFEEKYR